VYLDDSLRYKVSGVVGYYGDDTICWGSAIAYNFSKTSKTSSFCYNVDFVVGYWNSAAVYPYSGSIGLAQALP